MNICRVCRANRLESILALGAQPVANHFGDGGVHAVTHDLSLGVCTACGASQLVEPFPLSDLLPRYDWITYREPEGHLDAVVERLLSRIDLPKDAVILGASVKDRSMLERFERLGFRNTALVQIASENGAARQDTRFETTAGLLPIEPLDRLLSRTGPAHLIIARHIVEHTATPGAFVARLSEMLAPGGALVLEAPDCADGLRNCDYAMLWEEHATYFTAETLPQTLTNTGLTQLGLETYPSPLEDLLVLTARKDRPASNRGVGPIVAAETVARSVDLARRYAAAFESWSEQYRRTCEELTRDGRKLAIYGAGHLSTSFINFHALSGFFAFVVDDTPQKRGLRLSGCDLPIVGRDQLTVDALSACLMGLSPHLEDKIIANNPNFRETGGAFYSILAQSKHSLRTYAGVNASVADQAKEYV